MTDYRQHYHLMPETGWLNDPNGLCFFQGRYHIFFQEDDTDIRGKKKQWGHYSTTDFRTYKKEITAIHPDHARDKDGAYSGSAIVKDNELHLFYTGNVKHIGDYDYIHAGREHNLMHVVSKDGIHFTEKECVLTNEDYPNDVTCHVRDPKVYEENGMYYMVLGARTNEDTGCILVYQSTDLKEWKYSKRYTPKDTNGYMLECPDYIVGKNTSFLLCSPQGLTQDGYNYENIYDSGYYKIEDSALVQYTTLDHGFDFYAPQTFTVDNRTILIGWMGMPDADYTCPTKEWMHCLTLPRTLKYEEKIRQYPIQEILDLRYMREIHTDSFEIEKSASIHFEVKNDFKMELNSIGLTYSNSLLTLDVEPCGCGRTQRHIDHVQIENVSIFIDESSVEIFVNDGEYTMTTRYFDEESTMKIQFHSLTQVESYKMHSFEILKETV